MRVSIITVVRNARTTVRATLDSVTGQTWPDREVIVIDGLSTDGTIDVVREYADRIDQLIVEKDAGIYDAMNKGIRAATGDWLIFMNAGDVFSDEHVLERVAPVLQNGHAILCGAFEKVWDGYSVACLPRPLGVGLIPSCHQATFVGAAVARQNPFDVSLRVGADYDQVCRIAKQTRSDVIMTDVMIAKVQGEGFSTANSGVAHRDYRDVIIRHYGWTRGWAWYVRTIAWTAVTSVVKRIVPVSITARIRWLRSSANRS